MVSKVKATSVVILLLIPICVLADLPPSQHSRTTPNSECSSLVEIRSLPFDAEDRSSDAAYASAMAGGTRLNTCLVALMTNADPISDPRQSPNKANSFVMGDLAYMMFVRINGLQFEELLPSEIATKIAADGTDAYFSWVQRKGSRECLQKNAKKWLALNASK